MNDQWPHIWGLQYPSAQYLVYNRAGGLGFGRNAQTLNKGGENGG